MKTMLPRDYQLMLENKYSKANIRSYILKDIAECKELMDKLTVCTQSINIWINENHYESKKESLQKLKEVDITELLVDMLSVLLTQSYKMEITAAVGLVAGFTPWKDYKEAIKRSAELLYHMAACDIIDMSPAFLSETDTILISNKYGLSGETAKYIEMSKFTPPMVCVPETVKNARESGYLTKQKFSILKPKHMHNYPINLSSINKFNSTPLSLDMEFLKMVEDEISITVDSEKEVEMQTKNFNKFRLETYDVCLEMYKAGNQFYLTTFYDARGRTYSRGYHINYQGNSYRKAMINMMPVGINEDIEQYKDLF